MEKLLQKRYSEETEKNYLIPSGVEWDSVFGYIQKHNGESSEPVSYQVTESIISNAISRAKVQKIVIEAIAGTKDLTIAIDELTCLHNINKTEHPTIDSIENIIGKELYGDGWKDNATLNNIDCKIIESLARKILELLTTNP